MGGGGGTTALEDRFKITSWFVIFQVVGPGGFIPEGLFATKQTGRTVERSATSSELPSTSATRGEKMTALSRLLIVTTRYKCKRKKEFI